MLNLDKLTLLHKAYGQKPKRGAGTVEEQRRGKQPKAPKKGPKHRVYRPYGGYLPYPDSPIGKIWRDDALLRREGYMLHGNWLIGDLSDF